MRKLIAAAAVLAVTSAHAAEELKFGDLNYFLKQGQFNVLVDANSGFSKFTDTSTYEKRGYTFDTQFAYAINDKLNAFVGLSYAFDMQLEDKTTTTNADVDQDGLANPAIGLNYRLLNQNSSEYNFDLGAIARIKIQDAETGSSTGQDVKDGNNATGRNSLEVNARIGKKWNEANEWQLAAGLQYNLKGESFDKSPAGDVKNKMDDSLDAFVRASYQYRPVNEFMILVSAQLTRLGQIDGKNKSNNAVTKVEDYVDKKFGFTAKYLVTDDFIFKFNYSQSNLDEIAVYEGGNKSVIDKRRASHFGVGVDFLF
jgi:hypothetical protein